MHSRINTLLGIVSLSIFFIASCSKSSPEPNQTTNDPGKVVTPADSINISEVFGVCHVGGQNHFTGKPFLIEGAEEILKLGSKCIKVWFEHVNKKYPYNSSWSIDVDNYSYADLAQTSYFQQLFSMPFKTYSLELTNSKINWKDGLSAAEKISVYNSMYDLTKYFLTQYKNREVSFILEMWEGDWTLRGGTQHWKKGEVHADAPVRVKNMIDWVTARQKGVDRARNEIRKSKCKVYNALEVNRIFDGMEGIPTLTDNVLPNVQVDMVSWSAYDGKSQDGLKMYKGIDYIRQHLIPTAYMKGAKVVFIGEVVNRECLVDREINVIHYLPVFITC